MQGDTVRGNPRSAETLTAKLSMSTFKGTPLAGRHPRIANTYSSCAIETLDRKKPNVCVYVLNLTQTHSRLTLGKTATQWYGRQNQTGQIGGNMRQRIAKHSLLQIPPHWLRGHATAPHAAHLCRLHAGSVGDDVRTKRILHKSTWIDFGARTTPGSSRSPPLLHLAALITPHLFYPFVCG